MYNILPTYFYKFNIVIEFLSFFLSVSANVIIIKIPSDKIYNIPTYFYKFMVIQFLSLWCKPRHERSGWQEDTARHIEVYANPSGPSSCQ